MAPGFPQGDVAQGDHSLASRTAPPRGTPLSLPSLPPRPLPLAPPHPSPRGRLLPCGRGENGVRGPKISVRWRFFTTLEKSRRKVGSKKATVGEELGATVGEELGATEDGQLGPQCAGRGSPPPGHGKGPAPQKERALYYRGITPTRSCPAACSSHRGSRG